MFSAVAVCMNNARLSDMAAKTEFTVREMGSVFAALMPSGAFIVLLDGSFPAY
jgi:hypothetical protein